MKILTAQHVGITWICLLLANPKKIRFLIPWVASLRSNPLKDENVWIIFEAKEWLESFLNPNMTVFEWGSGGSTISIVKRVKKLVSVEHNRDWYCSVQRILKEKHITNCEYLLVEPEPFFSLSNFMDPKNYASGSPKYKNMSFENYAKSIESFPNEHFNLIIIDGRARPSCILHAMPKVKSQGGFIMLDNSERLEYQIGKDLLIDWEHTDFFGPGPYGIRFWQTTIWKKPVHEKEQDGEKYEQN